MKVRKPFFLRQRRSDLSFFFEEAGFTFTG